MCAKIMSQSKIRTVLLTATEINQASQTMTCNWTVLTVGGTTKNRRYCPFIEHMDYLRELNMQKSGRSCYG